MSRRWSRVYVQLTFLLLHIAKPDQISTRVVKKLDVRKKLDTCFSMSSFFSGSSFFTSVLIWSGFAILHIVSMGESKSRSNGGLSKEFHPHHMRNYEHVTFGLCVFLVSFTVSTGESESRSNGRVVKGFHPRHTWNYEHVIFGLCIFFEFVHCANGWT